MKILSIGDIHGESIWEKAPLEEADKIVFLGDYVDSFCHNDLDIIKNLEDIIEYKLKHEDKVTLLWGNHDLMYYFLDNSKFKCFGYRDSYAIKLNSIFKHFKHLFQVAYRYENLLYTHAGVTNEWLKFNRGKIDFIKNLLETDEIDVILNFILHSRHYDILSQTTKVNGGTDKFSSPIWLRPEEIFLRGNTLLNGYRQIVGHSRVSIKQDYKDDKGDSIVYTALIEDLIEMGEEDLSLYFHWENV